MNKNVKKGTLVGLLAPIVAYVVYVGFYLEADIEETYHSIVEMNKLSHVISLSVLINLLLFFMFYNSSMIITFFSLKFNHFLWSII